MEKNFLSVYSCHEIVVTLKSRTTVIYFVGYNENNFFKPRFDYKTSVGIVFRMG